MIPQNQEIDGMEDAIGTKCAEYEQPSQECGAKLKKMSLIAQLKYLDELCYNLNPKHEEYISNIKNLIDEAVGIA